MLFACGSSPERATEPPSPPAAPAAPEKPLLSDWVNFQHGLIIRARLPKATFRADEPITVTTFVKNETLAVIDFVHNPNASAVHCGISLSDSDGKIVMDYNPAPEEALDVETYTFQPEDEKQLTASLQGPPWKLSPLAPGTYTMTGWMKDTYTPGSSPVFEFRIHIVR